MYCENILSVDGECGWFDGLVFELGLIITVWILAIGGVFLQARC